ncbi:MAG: hypothetical protein ACYTF0_01990 [Planctomycetota bacterium]
MRGTALSSAEMAFGLAYWLHRQDVDASQVRRHLASDHRRLFARSHRYISRRLAATAA